MKQYCTVLKQHKEKNYTIRYLCVCVHDIYISPLFCFFVALGTEHRALSMFGKCSTMTYASCPFTISIALPFTPTGD